MVHSTGFGFLLQALLFNPPPNSKPFSRGTGIIGQDLDLYIDCFVSCFRITPHNNDVLKVCLNPHSPPMYHFILVNALHRIITQVRTVDLCCLVVFMMLDFSYLSSIPVYGRHFSLVQIICIGLSSCLSD